MYISLRTLEALSLFQKTQSLVKTAEALSTTQPTITRWFQELEKMVPQPVFEMRGRRKVLTEYGLSLSEVGLKRLDGLAEELRTLSNSFSSPQATLITIGGRREVLKRHFSGLEFPCSLKTCFHSSRELRHEIQKNELDMVVTQENVDTAFYSRKKLFQEQWFLCIPWKFGSRATIEKWKASAMNYPLAIYDLKQWSGHPFLSKFFPIAFRQQVFECPDWDVISQRVRLGLNWSVLPESYSSMEKVQRFALPEMEPTHFYLYYKRNLRHQKWFLNWLESSFN